MHEVRSHGLSVLSEGLETPLDAGSDAATDVDAVLNEWDRDIERVARSVSRLAGGSRDDADDFAQAARISLARSVRRGGPSKASYRRRIIKNAALSAARRARRRFGALSTNRVEFEETSHDGLVDTHEDVGDWVRNLPDRLRRVYRLLYVEDMSQRQAAAAMGVTQPRIAQLHADLKDRARTAFAAV